MASTICCRSCDCPCTLEGCLGSIFNGLRTVLRSFHYTRVGESASRRCARLFIWNCAHHDGSKYIVDDKCLTIVRTLVPTGSRSAYDGPFFSPHHGPILNTEPYWFAGCGIGGFEIDSSWWRPSDSNLGTIYGIAQADIGAMAMPAIGEKHTLILYVRFWRDERILWTIPTTGPTNGSGPGGDTLDIDSNVVLEGVHLTCPGNT